MAKKKYYAVAKGKTPGIYFTWDDCKAQVEHFPGASYKGFATIEEAEAFINAGGFAKVGAQMSFEDVGVLDGVATSNEVQAVSDKTHLVAYVDGSYEDSQKRYAYGCAIILPDEIVELNGSGDDADYVSMRNVAGEILGSECAIAYAIEHGYQSVTIYYDYEGIEKWANNIWKANKPGTIRYKAYVEEKRKQIDIDFCKVAAHTGVEYNELADHLAKKALGIED